MAYILSRTEDLYDVADWIKDRKYPGSQISFFDLADGRVYTPFQNRENVVYGKPLYYDGTYYFLRGDFNTGVIFLLRFLPGSTPATLKEFRAADLDLYNLELIGDPVHVASQTVGERFDCYYPDRFSIILDDNESVVHMEDGKIYISDWVEEGECDTAGYKYYERLIIKDFSGNVLSDEIGSLDQTPDGTWWIS